MSIVVEGKGAKSDASKVEVGNVFSRHSFGTIVEVNHDSFVVKNTDGRSWAISKAIVEDEFQFAEHAGKDKISVSRTELIELIMSIPRVAMTITFTKKPEPKEAAAVLKEGQGDLTDTKWKAKVKKAMEGEVRTVRGYHTAVNDEHGRLRFIVVGQVGGAGFRLVDPRTISECITCNKHFVVKRKR